MCWFRSADVFEVPGSTALEGSNSDSAEFCAGRGFGLWMSRRGGFGTLVPCGSTIDTHGQVVVALAVLERAGSVVCGHVPVAAHHIVDVLTISGSVCSGTSAETELGGGHERGPFVILQGLAKSIPINQSSNRVSIPIRTMRIEFTSRITSRNVHTGELAYTSNLDIVWCLDKVDAFETAVGDGTSTATRSSAVGNFNTFSVADTSHVWFGWSP